MDNLYFIQDTFFNEKLLMCPLKRSQCVSREEERPRGTPRLIEKQVNFRPNRWWAGGQISREIKLPGLVGSALLTHANKFNVVISFELPASLSKQQQQQPASSSDLTNYTQ